MESGLYLLGLLYLLWLYSLSLYLLWQVEEMKSGLPCYLVITPLYLLWQVEEMKSGLASRMGEQEQHAP